MKNLLSILSFVSFLFLSSCSEKEVEPIHFGKDQCELCKMGIEDAKFGTELITEKGRVYKFDDLSCMQSYATENATEIGKARLFVPDFISKELFPLESATLVSGGAVKSPMNGNVAAFKDKNQAEKTAQQLGATIIEK